MKIQMEHLTKKQTLLALVASLATLVGSASAGGAYSGGGTVGSLPNTDGNTDGSRDDFLLRTSIYLVAPNADVLHDAVLSGSTSVIESEVLDDGRLSVTFAPIAPGVPLRLDEAVLMIPGVEVGVRAPEAGGATRMFLSFEGARTAPVLVRQGQALRIPAERLLRDNLLDTPVLLYTSHRFHGRSVFRMTSESGVLTID